MRDFILRTAARLHSFSRRDEGVTVMEYGVTVALVSLVVAGLLAATGETVMGAIEDAILAAIAAV
ncbi:MAG: hypothetical protein HY875_08840 [Chloroflexi bacterium]|nr:hypothetical protein [Chloroflexota bacterium]